MTINQPPSAKKESAIKAPKAGGSKRTILIVVVFLVLFGALYYVYQQQPAQQALLSKQLASLQKLAAASPVKTTPVETEIAQAEKELKAVKDTFPRIDSAPEMLEELLALAKAHGMEVTGTSISKTKRTITEGKQKVDFPVISLQLSVKGQVPKFQNFLLSLDPKFRLYQVKEVRVDIAPTEKEQDKAIITIDIFCLSEGY